MTTLRRRVLRPPRSEDVTTPQLPRALERRRAQLSGERVTLRRWMTRLRRAFHEVEKRQRRVTRLEKACDRLETA